MLTIACSSLHVAPDARSCCFSQTHSSGKLDPSRDRFHAMEQDSLTPMTWLTDHLGERVKPTPCCWETEDDIQKREVPITYLGKVP